MFEFCRDKKPFNPSRMVGNRSRIGCCLFAIAVSIAVCGGSTANARANREQKSPIPSGLVVDVVLIDSTLSHSRDIQQAALRGVQVISFDGHRESPDNILQRTVGNALLHKRQIRSLSIVSHGSKGAFKLGNQWIDAAALLGNAKAWRMLDRVIPDYGHIYLYGCNVAGDQKAGAELIEALSDLTHTIVFASDDITGQGGDWDLEAVSTGGRIQQGKEPIQVLNTSALIDLPIALPNYSETAWSGTTTFPDGAISFTLSLTGGGTIDWSYVGSTNTLTISDNDSTTLASSLTITDNNGGLLIDTIILDTDLGTINSSTDIGTRVQIAEAVHVDHLAVDAGNGTIAEVAFLGLGSQNLGTVLIDANVTTLAMGAGITLAAGTDLNVVGNVSAITGIDELNDNAFITVDGNLGSMDVGLTWGGVLTVGGDVGMITVFNDFLSSGVVDIMGSVTTGLNLNSNMSGIITVGGNLADMNVGNNWGGALTVGGDAGTIFSANDLFGSGLIDISGNVNEIAMNSELDGVVIIGGNASSISIGYQGSGDITVGGDLNNFFSQHEYYGVLTAKKVIGLLVISADDHSWDGFYDNTTYVIETLVVYNGTIKSISGYLTMDLDADDSSGASPVDFANGFAAGNGPMAAVDADAYISNSAYNLSVMTVTLLDLKDGPSEVLACDTNGTNLNSFYNSSTGILTLSNVDTVGHYEQVLRTITYNNTAGTPTEGERRIIFAASNASGTLVTNSATAFISVSLTGSNNTPTGADGTLIVAEDATYFLQTVDFGYSDTDGDPLSQVQITALPSNGTLAYNAGAVTLNQVISKADIDLGLLTYTPALDASGSGYASFDFKVHDGSEYSGGSYTMTVDVTATNDAPTGADETIVMDEDTTYALQAVDFGYTDTEGDPLSQVQITVLPLSGTLAHNAGAVAFNQVIAKADIDLGLLTFTPALNASGSGYAGFDFRVHDGSDYSAGSYTLTVDVTAANDAPTGADAALTVAEDTTYAVQAVDFGYSDTEGDPLAQVKITALPSSGTLTYNAIPVSLNQVISKAGIDLGLLTYTPGLNANGSAYASFDFEVHDGSNYSVASYTLTVDVTAANDAPTGADASLTIAEDTSYTVQAVDFGYSDTEGDPLAQVQITSLPLSGTLAYNAGAVTLNQVISKADIDLGLLTFSPAPNASGSSYAGFDFRVHDGSDFSTGSYTLTVDVTAANEAPTGADGILTVVEDATYVLQAVDFGYSDIEGDPLAQVQITSLSLSGTLAYNAGAVTVNQVISKADIDLGLLTFTPGLNANGNGYAGFDFKVHDGSDYSAGSYTLTVDVTAANDAPTGADATLTIAEDSTYAVQAVDFGYSDTEGDPMAQVQITALPSNGTLAYNAVAVTLNQVISKADIDLGLLTFSPALNASGNGYASFDFKVHDGSDYSGASHTLTVDVTVANDAPTGAGTTIVMAEDTIYILTISDFGYTDPDGDLLSQVQITASPSHGILAYNSGAVTLNQVITRADIELGLLTYTPAANAYGTGYSYFRYRVHDGTQYASAFGTLLFDVTAVNDPPSISDYHFIINRGITTGGRVGTVSAFDADPEDTLTYSINTQNLDALFVMDPGSGAISLNKGVDLTDRNAASYAFSVHVSDGNATRNADITIQILETDEDSGTGYDNATDDGTLPPVIFGIKPENPPDIDTEVPPEPLKPQKPAGPQKPVAQDNASDPAETSRDELRGPRQPYQSNERPVILPHTARGVRPVVTSPKQQPQLGRRFSISKTSEPSAGKLLQPEAMPVDMNAPQRILDIPLDNIEVEGRGASTWFGKLFVGTITILIPFLSLLVIWGFQGTSLLASTLSTIPLWRTFDPLPILDTGHEGGPSQLQNDSAAEGDQQDMQDRAEAMFDSDDNRKPRQKGRRDLQ